jgi:hypothetical protein
MKGDSQSRRLIPSLIRHFREMAWKAYYKRQATDERMKRERKNTRGLPLFTCRWNPDDAKNRRRLRLAKFARRAARRAEQNAAALEVLSLASSREITKASGGGIIKRLGRLLAQLTKLRRTPQTAS